MIEWIRNLWASQKSNKSLKCRVRHLKGGSDFIFPDSVETEVLSNELLLLQYVHLRQLEESGLARAIRGGFCIEPKEVANSDANFRALFNLKSNPNQRFVCRFSGKTANPDFRIDLVPWVDGIGEWPHFQINGAQLMIGSISEAGFSANHSRSIVLNFAQFLALNTIQKHADLPLSLRTEATNLQAVFALKEAVKLGFNTDLAHFAHIEIEIPVEVALSGVLLADGSLQLLPAFSDIPTQDIRERRGQLKSLGETGSLRVGKKAVVLGENTVRAVREIFAVERIPRDKIQSFLKNPSAYIDASLVNLDCGFSELILGALKYQRVPLGPLDTTGISWFDSLLSPNPVQKILEDIESSEELQEAIEKIQVGLSNGEQFIVIKDNPVDISDREETTRAIENARRRLEHPTKNSGQAETLQETAAVGVVENLTQYSRRKMVARPWSIGGLKRTPLPHQKAGIDWILSLLSSEFPGGLLADDMGLGKTFQALVAMGLRLLDRDSVAEQRPMLVVAPLSLLEPWKQEVDATFENSPFSDVVVLQGKELAKFRIQGMARETRQEFGDKDILTEAEIRYALKVGEGEYPRLDFPGRLVLCSYQTLRDFQFSLCRVDWDMVVFDEAQNLKDPNTLQSIAARGLKAKFKLLMTGTPVENSLLDCWSIFHIALPGLLGEMREFRSSYINPIIKATPTERRDVKLRIGKELRDRIGNFMLRRIKEDHLPGLPPKSMISPFAPVSENWKQDKSLARDMQGRQLKQYDQILQEYRAIPKEQVKGRALVYLQKLKACSLHVDLVEDNGAPNWEQTVDTFAKYWPVLTILDDIQTRGEKVLLFLISKELQRQLATVLTQRFKRPVRIINGDTSVSAEATQSRLGIIKEFSEISGFGILILSPLAAGVGLTITCANHVIHLERHWNPAKEAQATDRCYRIGQSRPVSVWYPVSQHPQVESFDQKLHTLLCGKMQLKDCIMSTEPDDFELEGLL